MTAVSELIAVANRFGADPEYSRAGGGNASVKVDGILRIKPSGVPLATLTAEDLVGLRNDVLLECLASDEPTEGDPVQAAAAKALVDPPGGRRPSVEILFHALIPDTLVLHTHPLVANALTCNTDAEALAARLFGDDAVFVPYTDPGVPLARKVAEVRDAYTARTGRPAPGITLLGNHGIIVSGNTAAEVTERAERLTSTIAAALEASPLVSPASPAVSPASSAVSPASPAVSPASSAVSPANAGIPADHSSEPADAHVATLRNTVAPTLRGLLARDGRLPVVTSDAGELVRSVTTTPAGEAILGGGPLIPDQIVYAGSLPLVFTPSDRGDVLAELTAALADYRGRHGRDPIVTVVPGRVAFAAGADLAAARTALATFTDALRVARDADRIGTVRVLDDRERGFIENWEAESYRRSVAASARSGRMDGKVVMVTGAAQGFGLGIATELLAEGAHVVLADLNMDLATRNATELSTQHGPGRAVAVSVNVADEQSQLDAVAEVVATFGGLDVFISNAGVLRAEGVMTQPVADFDLVTNVNYRGYFLGVRAVAPILAAQHAACPQAWFDIIEINSKSGLEGSKRNFAYSGSKFGGIGLTQSFALELVEYGIKVNAICPGNYLDGPLWTDPERGLFVQYLRAGKVPGAQSIADVRAYYEAKVPMGRGCLPSDLAKTVYYLVDQLYETGQAVPVTGGQNMLN
ncbi:MAG: SDR family NAD(P)-dependent oxidoreductase [Propionibacteriaceae bacterium]|nr:SDR family NAD(P)-dependent oxidoreductase [Propionibacteriaceae bacterium]